MTKYIVASIYSSDLCYWPLRLYGAKSCSHPIFRCSIVSHNTSIGWGLWIHIDLHLSDSFSIAIPHLIAGPLRNLVSLVSPAWAPFLFSKGSGNRVNVSVYKKVSIKRMCLISTVLFLKLRLFLKMRLFDPKNQFCEQKLLFYTETFLYIEI